MGSYENCKSKYVSSFKATKGSIYFAAFLLLTHTPHTHTNTMGGREREGKERNGEDNYIRQK